MDVSVNLTRDKMAWLVRITAAGQERDRILADLEVIVGVYHEVEPWAYRVAGHREAALRRFAEQVRARGGEVAWSERRHGGRRGRGPAAPRDPA